MFKWASIFLSSIASALFVVTIFVLAARGGCPDASPFSIPQSPCVMFYDHVSFWVFLCGAGLTTLMLVLHLIVAAKKRIWGWFKALLIWPTLCFLCGVATGSINSDTPIPAISTFCALIGLVDLWFGIQVLKFKRDTGRISPSVEVPPS